MSRPSGSTTRVTDYRKMELGRVTRTFKGRTTGVIARCPECGERGDRSCYIPDPKEVPQRQTPYVGITHVSRMTTFRVPEIGLNGFRSSGLGEHHTTRVNASNVDDLLNVEERKRYDAWRAELIAFVERY